MRYFLPVVWAAGFVAALESGSGLWNSGTILLARQHLEHFDLSRRSLLSQRYLLPRSGRSPGPSTSDAARRSPGRSRPPTKAKASAQGAADLSLSGSNGQQNQRVLEGQSGVLRDQHHNWAIVKAESRALPGSEGGVKAKLRGGTVVGLVRPPPGGAGKIKIKKDGHTRHIDITNPEGDYHSEVSNRPGGVTLTASTGAGGSVYATSMGGNIDDRPTRS